MWYGIVVLIFSFIAAILQLNGIDEQRLNNKVKASILVLFFIAIGSVFSVIDQGSADSIRRSTDSTVNAEREIRYNQRIDSAQQSYIDSLEIYAIRHQQSLDSAKEFYVDSLERYSLNMIDKLGKYSLRVDSSTGRIEKKLESVKNDDKPYLEWYFPKGVKTGMNGAFLCAVTNIVNLTKVPALNVNAKFEFVGHDGTLLETTGMNFLKGIEIGPGSLWQLDGCLSTKSVDYSLSANALAIRICGTYESRKAEKYSNTIWLVRSHPGGNWGSHKDQALLERIFKRKNPDYNDELP